LLNVPCSPLEILSLKPAKKSLVASFKASAYLVAVNSSIVPLLNASVKFARKELIASGVICKP